MSRVTSERSYSCNGFMGNGRRGNITDQRRQRGYHGEAFSTSSLHRGSFASMPMTHFSVNALIALT
ncbi:MAG TPA: hypothetical protein VEO92_07475, partial [Candidatus Nitrosocosmicus sp.]|nr:hypothetical protein [Candidatus Nitrosocosmicus sp.]